MVDMSPEDLATVDQGHAECDRTLSVLFLTAKIARTMGLDEISVEGLILKLMDDKGITEVETLQMLLARLISNVKVQ